MTFWLLQQQDLTDEAFRRFRQTVGTKGCAAFHEGTVRWKTFDSGGRHGVRFWLNNEKSDAVEINLPQDAETENGASAIALNEEGQAFVVHQGRLKVNTSTQPQVDVTDKVFQARTGLQAADVRIGGAQTKRSWHVVTALDGATEKEVITNAARFALYCWKARVCDFQFDPKRSVDRLTFDQSTDGKRESSDGYSYELQRRFVEANRLHGAVWQQLEKEAHVRGLSISKPGEHRYEVDALVGSIRANSENKPPMLIEIKTGVGANDIYTALGQLFLYPKLISKVGAARRIMLVPTGLSAVLRKAVESSETEVFSYETSPTEPKKPKTVRFASELLGALDTLADKRG